MKSILFALAVTFGFILPASVTSSRAQQVISYQGMATDNGSPANGPHNVALTIYTDSTGGTPINPESQFSVAFDNGLFNIQIGTDLKHRQ